MLKGKVLAKGRWIPFSWIFSQTKKGTPFASTLETIRRCQQWDCSCQKFFFGLWRYQFLKAERKPALSGGKKNAQKNKSHWVKMNLQHWGDVSTIIPANEAVGWDGCKITWTMLVWGSCFCLMDQIWEVFWEVSTPIAQLISFRVWNMPWRYEQAQMWHVYFFPRVGCRNFWIQHWCILVQPPSGCQSQQHLMTWNCVSAQWVTQTVRYFCARYVPEINIFLNSGCCFELSVAIASGA